MKKIWTNGCFDILHIGHIKMLQYARSLGDYLIVGIDSDNRVNELKGSKRPINNEQNRKELLLSIKYVDEVHIFDSKDHMCQILKDANIKHIVVGEEYKNKEVTGENIVNSIHYFKKVDGFSTSNTIQMLKDQ